MDTATIGVISAIVIGFITAVTAWFKLSRAAKFTDGRLSFLEKQAKDFITSEQKAERVKICENRFSTLELSIKEELDRVHSSIANLDNNNRCFDRDITRIQESLRSIDNIKNKLDDLSKLREEVLDKFTKRGDFIREMQIMTSHLRIVQEKIDHIDDKIDEKMTRK